MFYKQQYMNRVYERKFEFHDTASYEAAIRIKER
jgi:hypothetical protein